MLDRTKHEGKNSEQGRTVDITSNRKNKERGRAFEENTLGKAVRTLSSSRKHKMRGNL